MFLDTIASGRRLGVPERRPAPRSNCPHCGRETPTVRGVCTECWGSKGGRLFTVKKRGPEGGIDEDFWLRSWGCSWTGVVIVVTVIVVASPWI